MIRPDSFLEPVRLKELLTGLTAGFRAIDDGTALEYPRVFMEKSHVSVTNVGCLYPGKNLAVNKTSICGVSYAYDFLTAYDTRTGKLKATLDWTEYTALRTAATSALAIQYLKRTNGRIMALLGSGLQAEFQALVLSAVVPLEAIRVYSPNEQHRETFAKHIRRITGLSVISCNSSREATADADIVTCATNSNRPVFAERDLKQNVHINAIGAYNEHTLELPAEICGKATVFCVDNLENCLKSGDLSGPIRKGILDMARITPLSKLVNSTGNNDYKAGLTIYKSTGCGIEDAVLASQLIALRGK